MKTRNLKTIILAAFFAVIGILSILVSVLGYYQIRASTVLRAQREIKNHLKVARWVYEFERDKIVSVFDLVESVPDAGVLREKMGLDYVVVVQGSDPRSLESEVARKSLEGTMVAGMRRIGADELKRLGQDLFDHARVDIVPTPKAKPSDRKVLDTAMAIECAKPIKDDSGQIQKVLYGGKIINRHFDLVDKIRDFVFEDRLYKGRPVGTVTVFLDDVRVATNVLDDRGQRAIGTRVSERVGREVLELGKTWLDRAFVVNDWYLTAYEPIKDITGKVIGILYVGILEKPFIDQRWRLFFVFIGVVSLASVMAVVLALILANVIVRRVTAFSKATTQLAKGELGYRVPAEPQGISELETLAGSFNEMAHQLADREKNLEISNAKLSALNKNYLDLISFVTHELSAILSSTVINAYSLRDGFLGLVNFKQRRVLDSIVRNLDYFASTIANFLNLSRIEKGEMSVKKSQVLLKEEIFDVAVESFSRMAQEKEMTIENALAGGMKVLADSVLLQIVANNLIGNAVKYGRPKGKMVVRGNFSGEMVRVEIYNDGRPMEEAERQRLFKKFSRLDAPETKKAKGTGLGLFLTREIVEKHGGRIWVEPQSEGNTFIFEIKSD